MRAAATTDRLDVWRDLIRDTFVALDVQADRGERFTGTVRTAEVGHLRVASVESERQRCRRTRELAHRDDSAYLQVGLLTRGGATVAQDGREAELRPGDFAVYETERPFLWDLSGGWELLVFTWPRATVAVPDTASQQLTARALAGDDGLGAIVGRVLRDLVAAPPALSATGGVRLADEVVELVVTVASEHVQPTGSSASAASEDLLRRIDAHVLERLADPGLSPASIAAAHFISTRHLHRLFAQRGTTVGQTVHRLRLERCRRDLLDPGAADRSISDISRRWGFLDGPTFSRAFRGAYGTSPSDWRAGRRRA